MVIRATLRKSILTRQKMEDAIWTDDLDAFSTIFQPNGQPLELNTILDRKSVV